MIFNIDQYVVIYSNVFVFSLLLINPINWLQNYSFILLHLIFICEQKKTIFLKRTKILLVLLRVKFKLFYPDRSFLPPYLAGSCRKDAWKSPDPAGKHGKYLEYGSSIPSRNFPIISGRMLPENHWNLSESTEKNPGIPTRNTASNFLVLSVASRPFPAVRCSPGVSTVCYVG